TALAPPCRVLDVSGIRLGIVSVFEPPVYRDGEGRYETHAGEFSIPEPLAALRRDVASIRSSVDLVCVMGRATPRFARRIAAEIPGIDVLVSNEPFALVVDPRRPQHPAEMDSTGFVGSTLVIYAASAQYGVDVVTLGLDAHRRVSEVATEERVLDATVLDDPDARRTLTRFYDGIGLQTARSASVERPFGSDTVRQSGLYVGAAACAGCHASEYRQWQQTPHASAFRTLLKVHRNFQPRCVACHVVAFGAPHGYQL